MALKSKEKKELAALLREGIKYKVGGRTFSITQPYLGTMDYLSAEYIRLKYDPMALQADPINEMKNIARLNARRCATIIAIATLNGYWKIKLFKKAFSLYLYWQLKPDKLFETALAIQNISNLENFTYAIQLLHMRPRTTAPRAEIAEAEALTAPTGSGGL